MREGVGSGPGGGWEEYIMWILNQAKYHSQCADSALWVPVLGGKGRGRGRQEDQPAKLLRRVINCKDHYGTRWKIGFMVNDWKKWLKINFQSKLIIFFYFWGGRNPSWRTFYCLTMLQNESNYINRRNEHSVYTDSNKVSVKSGENWAAR